MPSRGKKRPGNWRPKPFALAGPQRQAGPRRRRMERAAPDPLVPPGYALRSTPGLEKVSDLLVAFMEPYREMEQTEDDSFGLLALAATAWNIGLLPIEKQEAATQEFLRLPPDGPLSPGIDRVAVLRDMVARRNEHFSAHRRAIMGLEVVPGTREGSTLRVLSSGDIALEEAEDWWAKQPWVQKVRAGARPGRSRR